MNQLLVHDLVGQGGTLSDQLSMQLSNIVTACLPPLGNLFVQEFKKVPPTPNENPCIGSGRLPFSLAANPQYFRRKALLT